MSKGYMPSVINRFNIYLRKNRLFGHTGEVELPAVKFLTETLEGAGVGGTMDIAVTGLTENMEISIPFTCISQDMARMLDPTEPLDLTLRGAVQAMDQGSGRMTFQDLRVVIRGFTKEYTPGTLKAGAKMSGSIAANMTYYKIEYDGDTFLEIDKLNDVCIINGNDVLAEVRDMC